MAGPDGKTPSGDDVSEGMDTFFQLGKEPKETQPPIQSDIPAPHAHREQPPQVTGDDVAERVEEIFQGTASPKSQAPVPPIQDAFSQAAEHSNVTYEIPPQDMLPKKELHPLQPGIVIDAEEGIREIAQRKRIPIPEKPSLPPIEEHTIAQQQVMPPTTAIPQQERPLQQYVPPQSKEIIASTDSEHPTHTQLLKIPKVSMEEENIKLRNVTPIGILSPEYPIDSLDRIVRENFEILIDTEFCSQGIQSAIKTGMPLQDILVYDTTFCEIGEGNIVPSLESPIIFEEEKPKINESKYTKGLRFLRVDARGIKLRFTFDTQIGEIYDSKTRTKVKVIPLSKELPFKLTDCTGPKMTEQENGTKVIELNATQLAGQGKNEYELIMNQYTDFCSSLLIDDANLKTSAEEALQGAIEKAMAHENPREGLRLLNEDYGKFVLFKKLNAANLKASPDFRRMMPEAIRFGKKQNKYDLIYYPGTRELRPMTYPNHPNMISAEVDTTGNVAVHYVLRHKEVLLSHFAHELITTKRIKCKNQETSKEYHIVGSETIDEILKQEQLKRFQAVEKDILTQIRTYYVNINQVLMEYRELAQLLGGGKFKKTMDQMLHGDIKKRHDESVRKIQEIADTLVMVDAKFRDNNYTFKEIEDKDEKTANIYNLTNSGCFYIPKELLERLKHLYANSAKEIVDEFYTKNPEFAKMFVGYKQLLIDDLDEHAMRYKKVANYLLPRKGLVSFENNMCPKLVKLFEVLPGQDGVDCFNEDSGTPFYGSLLIGEGYSDRANLNLTRASPARKKSPVPTSYQRRPQIARPQVRQTVQTARPTYTRQIQAPQAKRVQQKPKPRDDDDIVDILTG